MTFDVDNLTKSLAEYSPVANDAVNLIVKAIRPLGYILISVFFLLEMLSWHQLLKREGGGLTPKLWLEIGLKYLLAYILFGNPQQCSGQYWKFSIRLLI